VKEEQNFLGRAKTDSPAAADNGTAQNGTELAVIWTTVASVEDAQRLAGGLLEQRLAGCVQVDASVRSFYRWKGQTQSETEYRVVIKTLAELQLEAMRWIGENHPYELPQLIVLPVTDASEDYAGWIAEQVNEIGN